jgi:hypothetical protein
VKHEYETLRWPTNLDRAAIIERLGEVREAAVAEGLADFAKRFDGIGELPGPELGACVIEALTWLQDQPEHPAITAELAMIAMNLKNLK